MHNEVCSVLPILSMDRFKYMNEAKLSVGNVNQILWYNEKFVLILN